MRVYVYPTYHIYIYIYILQDIKTKDIPKIKTTDDMAEIQEICNVSKSQSKAKLIQEGHWVLIQLRA